MKKISVLDIAMFLLACAVFVAAICIRVEPAYAAPSRCMYPNTSARAVKVFGNGPVACALSTCRTTQQATTQVVPCTGGPSCANKPPYIEAWRAEMGAWAGLPACPTWTNTSTWQ